MRDAAHARHPWHEANQRYVIAKLAVLSGLFAPESVDAEAAQRELDAATAALPAPPALEVLASVFGLSSFERDLLLLCAGVELDSGFAARCAAAQGDARRMLPTFSFALAVLPHAHWSALGPGAPLRLFHLLEVMPGDSLTRAPLRIDERVLHFLVGVEHPDERLVGLVQPAPPASGLVPSHQRLAERIAALWGRLEAGGPVPVVELWGPERRAARDVAVTACAARGWRLDVLSAGALASRPDVERVGRLLAREMRLGRRALLIETDGAEASEAACASLVGRLVEGLAGPVLVGTRERMRLGNRPCVALEVPRPTADEQRALWKEALAGGGGGEGFAPSESLLDSLCASFELDGPAVRSVCASALSGVGPGVGLESALWEACRVETRTELEGLAQHLPPSATWDDLVLPEASLQALRAMTRSVRQRARVHGAWGFSERGERGLGVGALFAGPSGTGKTLAAEVLAADLRLDLFRVDLSQLVSKYLGETEKNLRRVFDAAERGAAILLFDEADALFGRRGEARDAHDRYANLEVAYLLQRMETYRGLAILTTNFEGALDPAFPRRLRFVVRFPLPGAAERRELWRRAFPVRAPTEGLDFERLAQLGLTGGGIRNVALQAAYLAAEAGTPVRMGHVLDAAQAEYEKLGRAAQGVQ